MTEIFAYANIILNFTLRGAFFFYASRRASLPLVNFMTLAFIMGLPFDLLRLIGGPIILIDGGVAAAAYQNWLLIENAYTAVQLAVAIVAYRAVFDRAIAPAMPPQASSSNFLSSAALGLGALSVLALVVTASLDFGLINWLADPRAGYQFHRNGVGLFYAVMTTSFSTATFFALIAARKRPRLLVATLIASMPMAYLNGSKSVILGTFVLAFWAYIFQFRRVPLLAMSLAAIPLAILLLANFGSVDPQGMFAYFDYYPNSTLMYDALSNGRTAFYDGQIMTSSLWGIVPRALYPDKPYAYGAAILSDAILPGMAAQGHTVGFAGPMAAYADFGLVGVLASAVIDPMLIANAFLTGWVGKLYAIRGSDFIAARPLAVIVLLHVFNPSAELYYTFPLNVIFLAFVGGWLLICSRLSWSIARPVSTHTGR